MNGIHNYFTPHFQPSNNLVTENAVKTVDLETAKFAKNLDDAYSNFC